MKESIIQFVIEYVSLVLLATSISLLFGLRFSLTLVSLFLYFITRKLWDTFES
jgi:hypothetical protein